VNPLGIEQIEFDDPRRLQPDEQGILTIPVEIAEARAGSAGQDTWRIESVGLELRGRTAEEGRAEHESR
jgi:hypothetical protein